MADQNPAKQNAVTNISDEKAWERSGRLALALLEQGFRLGGLIPASRDKVHER